MSQLDNLMGVCCVSMCKRQLTDEDTNSMDASSERTSARMGIGKDKVVPDRESLLIGRWRYESSVNFAAFDQALSSSTADEQYLQRMRQDQPTIAYSVVDEQGGKSTWERRFEWSFGDVMTAHFRMGEEGDEFLPNRRKARSTWVMCDPRKNKMVAHMQLANQAILTITREVRPEDPDTLYVIFVVDDITCTTTFKRIKD